MTVLRIALVSLHVLVAVAAIGAGQALVFDSTGEVLTFKTAWLSSSPFPDYRFPGLFLVIVIGGTQLASAMALATRRRVGPVLSLASGLLLVTWLAIQWAIIGYQHPTQLVWAILFPTLAIMAAVNARHDPLLRALRSRARYAARGSRLGFPLAFGLVAALLAVYLTLLHPWFMNWGATSDEQQMMLPGDEPGGDANDYFTRAISIQAPPSAVWPWLLQIGQDRAGFYSNTWLENLFGGDIHNGSAIQAEWQDRHVGDRVPMAGAEGTALLGDVTKLTVRVLEPERVIADLPGRFVLLGQPDGTTRLLLREPLDIPERRGVVGPLLWDPMHFTMEQRMLRGIKERAEGRPLVLPPIQTLARLGWLVAGLGLMAFFVSRRWWALGLIAPGLVGVPTVALTGDYDAALAGGLAVGITTLGALAFGRRWWSPFLVLAATVLLVLLLAPDAYTAVGLLFLASSAAGFMGVVARWLRFRTSASALTPARL